MANSIYTYNLLAATQIQSLCNAGTVSTCHIHWSDAVLEPHSSIASLLHDSDTSPRHINVEGTIGVPAQKKIFYNAESENLRAPSGGRLRLLILTFVCISTEFFKQRNKVHLQLPCVCVGRQDFQFNSRVLTHRAEFQRKDGSLT